MTLWQRQRGSNSRGWRIKLCEGCGWRGVMWQRGINSLVSMARSGAG